MYVSKFCLCVFIRRCAFHVPPCSPTTLAGAWTWGRTCPPPKMAESGPVTHHNASVICLGFLGFFDFLIVWNFLIFLMFWICFRFVWNCLDLFVIVWKCLECLECFEGLNVWIFWIVWFFLMVWKLLECLECFGIFGILGILGIKRIVFETNCFRAVCRTTVLF